LCLRGIDKVRDKNDLIHHSWKNKTYKTSPELPAQAMQRVLRIFSRNHSTASGRDTGKRVHRIVYIYDIFNMINYGYSFLVYSLQLIGVRCNFIYFPESACHKNNYLTTIRQQVGRKCWKLQKKIFIFKTFNILMSQMRVCRSPRKVHSEHKKTWFRFIFRGYSIKHDLEYADIPNGVHLTAIAVVNSRFSCLLGGQRSIFGCSI
jgi:hypothetical protein